MLFAVSGHPHFLDLRVAGVILLARGAAGYWLALGPGRRAHLASQFRRLRTTVVAFEAYTRDLTDQGGSRVRLSDLLKENGQR